MSEVKMVPISTMAIGAVCHIPSIRRQFKIVYQGVGSTTVEFSEVRVRDVTRKDKKTGVKRTVRVRRERKKTEPIAQGAMVIPGPAPEDMTLRVDDEDLLDGDNEETVEEINPFLLDEPLPESEPKKRGRKGKTNGKVTMVAEHQVAPRGSRPAEWPLQVKIPGRLMHRSPEGSKVTYGKSLKKVAGLSLVEETKAGAGSSMIYELLHAGALAALLDHMLARKDCQRTYKKIARKLGAAGVDIKLRDVDTHVVDGETYS
jgi:hypothetical protein